MPSIAASRFGCFSLALLLISTKLSSLKSFRLKQPFKSSNHSCVTIPQAVLVTSLRTCKYSDELFHACSGISSEGGSYGSFSLQFLHFFSGFVYFLSDLSKRETGDSALLGAAPYRFGLKQF
ncbi:hypothetical protein, unlikely [Trypanosoma congolense IL3000]|uniref:T. congolense-specific, cell surface-expressed gene family n=1 Tax=Trypanosoma congolense (strain IL3000) TaxID=1068625 RepID=F9W7N9_TRYCI|nr:hypothetical protein, unlikely [Trypanosoma congolense IL3000]